MKIVALEEHMITAQMSAVWEALPPERQDESVNYMKRFGIGEQLADITGERLASMDDAGVAVQVLSLTPPGLNDLEAAEAVPLAREINGSIAEAVNSAPGRFEGFAALPTQDPEAAALELEHAVLSHGLRGAMLNGRTGQLNMDLPQFEPIYEMAVRLGVPLYIHPQMPPPGVREAYYSGFGAELDFAFASAGLGWHYEAGIQFMRLILSGTLDRYPELQLILGHWGEVVLFYLDRIALLDNMSNLERPMRAYFEQNAYYTPSGIFSQHWLQQTVRAVGIERIMFSVDYPFQDASNGGARRFLEEAEISEAERELIAHGNWERLCSASSVLPS